MFRFDNDNNFTPDNEWILQQIWFLLRSALYLNHEAIKLTNATIRASVTYRFNNFPVDITADNVDLFLDPPNLDAPLFYTTNIAKAEEWNETMRDIFGTSAIQFSEEPSTHHYIGKRYVITGKTFINWLFETVSTASDSDFKRWDYESLQVIPTIFDGLVVVDN
jgi:hypothetical protein